MNIIPIIIIVIVVVLLISILFFAIMTSCYKKCPPHKIIVIFGKMGKDKEGNKIPFKCYANKATVFIVPFFQTYDYLDTSPINGDATINEVLSRNNIKLDLEIVYSVKISTDADRLNNAAKYLLGLANENILEKAMDIIKNQIKLTTAEFSVEEIRDDDESYIAKLYVNIDSSISDVGLELVHFTILSINDQLGILKTFKKLDKNLNKVTLK